MAGDISKYEEVREGLIQSIKGELIDLDPEHLCDIAETIWGPDKEEIKFLRDNAEQDLNI